MAWAADALAGADGLGEAVEPDELAEPASAEL